MKKQPDAFRLLFPKWDLSKNLDGSYDNLVKNKVIDDYEK